MKRENDLAQRFNGLAHPRRVRIYDALKESSKGVLTYAEIARQTGIPAPSLGHHLRVMLRAQCIRHSVKGPYSEYRVRAGSIHYASERLR